MEIGVIGVSHQTAPVHRREQLALPGELARSLLRAMRADGSFNEALVLDTCNRTEIYFTAGRCETAAPRLLELIGRMKQTPAEPSDFYRFTGSQAVRHLFSVAASLDSQVLGEDQILNQLKDAYRIACEESTIHFLLNKLLQRAFRAGKRVRTETGIGCGSPSVARAAVDFCSNLLPELAGKAVLVVGAGRTAELAAQLLIRHGVSRLTLANRTIARARHVAHNLQRLCDSLHGTPRTSGSDALTLAACGGPESFDASVALAEAPTPSGTAGEGEPASWSMPGTMSKDQRTGNKEQGGTAIDAIPLDDIPAAIIESDLALCCTASPNLVLTHDSLAPVLCRHEGRPLFIVDVAVPRDADPRLSGLPNVFLYNIDDLECGHIEADSQLMLDKARAIVEHEVCQFSRWLDSLQVAPTIKLLQRRLDLIQQKELKKFEHKIAGLNRRQLEHITRRLCSKIIHKPLAFIHSLPESSDDTMAAIEMIRRLFDLDSLEKTDEPDRSQKP